MPNTRDLTSFLADARWKDRFDDEILAAAHAFVPKVKNLRVSGSGDEGFAIDGAVSGEETRVDLWHSAGSWDFETTCGCDVGAFCHHAAALLLRTAKEKDASRLVGKPPPGSLAAALPSARELLKDPPPDLPRLSLEPSFELYVTRGPADRATRVLLQSLGQAEPDFWISAEARVIYGEFSSSLRSAAPDWVTPVTLPGGQPALIQHDAGAEAAAAQQLRDTGLSSLQSNPSWRFLLNLKGREPGGAKSPDRWFPDPGRVPVDAFWHRFRGEMVARLEDAGWRVHIADNVGHRVHDADPDRWQTALSPGDGGWFSLSVGFDVAGKRYDLLPILAGLLENDFLEETLDRPDNGHVYAPLPDGDALRLPIGRVRRILHHLAAMIDPKFPDRARLHALDAASLAGLEGLGLEVPPDLAELSRKLHGFSGIDPAPSPAGLRATLRDYQLDGFRWMQFLARHGLHGILADDMGLGKTVQTLAWLLHLMETANVRNTNMAGSPPSETTHPNVRITNIRPEGARPFRGLVVCPKSVTHGWLTETARFAPGLQIAAFDPVNPRAVADAIEAPGQTAPRLLVANYAQLRLHATAFRGAEWDAVVLDEGQFIKNPGSQVAVVARSLRARHRLVLTGTPIENRLTDLWSLFAFAQPGLLGDQPGFRRQYPEADPAALARLHRRVQHFLLRRTKAQAAPDLPTRTEDDIIVDLEGEQRALYDAELKRARAHLMGVKTPGELGAVRFHVLASLLRLRQICCHPALVDPAHAALPSAKLDALLERIEELADEGHQVLVFSQFTGMLEIIRTRLAAANIGHLILTGATENRAELVDRFQTDKSKTVFLLSLKAAGFGLNLTAASYAFLYDPWWNPAAEAQAIDRIHRIGQTRPVMAYRLIADNSVEQKIRALQHEKSALASAVIQEESVATVMDLESLREILS